MTAADSEPLAVKQEDADTTTTATAAADDTDLAFKIAAQIEYYFSDVNLRKDKFMVEEMEKGGSEGWISIQTLLTFNRLKALTQDPAVVVSSLKTPHPETEDSLVVSEDGTKVRRKVPFVQLTDEQLAELNARTIHFKGITQDATLDEIRGFCSQYGKVVSVEMRRFRDNRKFKGCVMCVYATKEEADKALAGTEVYNENIRFLREDKNSWQVRKDKFSEERKTRGKKSKAGTEGGVESKEGTEDADPVKVKSAIIVLEGVAADVKFETIKSFFAQHGSVVFVDTEADTRRAYVRFANENEALAVLKTVTLVKDTPVTDVKDEKIEAKAETPEVTEAAPVDPGVKQEESSANGGDGEKKDADLAVAETTDGPKGENGSSDDCSIQHTGSLVTINGVKFGVRVLEGEEEVSHWRRLNELRKKLRNSRDERSSSGQGGHRKGRGFKRGGGGYKGKNDRNDRRNDGPSGEKRKPGTGDPGSTAGADKRLKAE